MNVRRSRAEQRRTGWKPTVHIVATLAVIMAVVMNLATWAHLDREQTSDMDAARQALAFQARVFGDHVSARLSSVAMFLDEIAVEAKLSDRVDKNHQAASLGLKLLRIDSIDSVVLFEPDGDVALRVGAFVGETRLAELLQVSERHRLGGTELRLHSLSDMEGGQALAMSRTLERPDGRFGGIATAIVQSSVFTAFQEASSFADYDFVLVHNLSDGPIASWWSHSGAGVREEQAVIASCGAGCGLEPVALLQYRLDTLSPAHEVASYQPSDQSIRVYVGRSVEAIVAGQSDQRAHVMAGVLLASMVVLTISVLAAGKATQSARAEERNRKLSSAIGEASTGVIVTDGQGRIEYANKAFETVTGRRIADEDADEDGVTAQLLDAMQTGIRWQGELSGQRPDGSPFWLAAGTAPVTDSAGHVEGFIGLAEDITERKRSEDKLRLADVVFQTASEAILICDAERKIIRVNPAFETTTGYSAADVIGKDPKILASGRHSADFYQAMHGALERDGRWEGEITNRRKDGEIFHEWLSINAVRDGLGKTILYASVFMDITKRKATEALIRRQANYDRLTDLPNRHLLHDRLDRTLAEAKRHGKIAAVLFVDLDRFKWINDHRGHETGDRVLVAVANRILSVVRESDTVARIGGDEFVVVLSDLDKTGSVDKVAQKILLGLEQPISVDHGDLHVSGSIGVSMYPNDGETPDELLRKADQAMYRAKSVGRNAVRFFEPQMNEDAERRAELTVKLHAACQNEQIVAYYQPIFSMEDGAYKGAECLARWRDSGQVVSPGTFIPIAEDNGQIEHVMSSVMANVGRDVSRWRDDLPSDFYFTLNIAPRQFFSQDLVPSMLRFIGQNGFNARQFVLEITENVGLEDREQAFSRIRQLRELGFRIALDDFGAGYSSLGYLQSLAVDILKIDRAFVSDLPGSLESRAIIETVSVLSHRLGIQTVAEGVSQVEQLEYLRGTGCTLGQGFLISEPLPPVLFADAFKQKSPRHPLFTEQPHRPALKLINQ